MKKIDLPPYLTTALNTLDQQMNQLNNAKLQLISAELRAQKAEGQYQISPDNTFVVEKTQEPDAESETPKLQPIAKRK